MVSKRTKIIIFFLLLSIVGAWFFFRHQEHSVEFSLNSQPLVAINYFSSVNTGEEKMLEQKNRLMIAGRVFALENPEIKDVGLAVDGGFGQFADYNLFLAGDRDSFFSAAKISDTAKNTNNNISTILNDEENQKFATLNPNQNYSVYLNIDNVFGFQSDSVIINNRKYDLSKKDTFYTINDFQSGEATSVGIKTTDARSRVTDAIFVTGKLNLNNSINRLVREDQSVLKLNGNHFSIKMPENSVLLLEPTKKIRLVNQDTIRSAPSSTNTFQYHHPYPLTFPQIDANNPHFTAIILSPDEYQISQTSTEKLLFIIVYFSLLVLVIILLLIFVPSVQITNFLSFSNMKKIGAAVINYCRQNSGEILVYILVLVGLLILRLNSGVGQYITTTNVSIVIVFFVLIMIRFSLRYLLAIIISLIIVVALLEEAGILIVAEKAGKLLFAVIFLTLILILFSKRKNISKAVNGKVKRKN